VWAGVFTGSDYSVAMDTKVAVWLPRALVESALIVMSILLALALDEWQEDQEIEELIDRSMINFVNELNRNRSRVEDVSVYHQGVWQVLEKWSAAPEAASVIEFRNIMEAMQPVVLTSSAWQTAVATGALGRMDFALVSALSQTYNTQFRFDTRYNDVLLSLLTPISLRQENLDITIYNATRFVADVSSSELELSAYYSQSLQLLAAYTGEDAMEIGRPVLP
jgi:hypothetical protein